MVKLTHVNKQHTKEGKKDPKFCLYHRYMHHPTSDCQMLQLNRKIQDRTLLLSPKQQRVHKTPFPNNEKDKNKTIVPVVIYGNVELGNSIVTNSNSTLAPTADRTIQRSPKNSMCMGPITQWTHFLLLMEHQESLTPKEGGLPLSCCLTQQTESWDEFAVDQEDSAAMKYKKSTGVDSKIAAKEDLEVIKLSNDPNISKLVSIYTSLSTVERNNLISLLKEHQDVFCLSI